jgi:hypothetical protein
VGLRELARYGPSPREEESVPPAARGLAISRRYLGPERCEHLLPSPKELAAAMAAALAEGSRVSVVLPPVGPRCWPRAEALLESAAAVLPGCEIVANDWGVLRAAADEPRLVPVMGRCLDRRLRDPRLEDALGPDLPQVAREALASAPYASRAFCRFRARLRIERIEIDATQLESPAAAFPDDLRLSLWTPLGALATGRVCLPAMLHRPPGEDRFWPGSCRRECLGVTLRPQAPRALLGRLDLLVVGNSVFYRHDDELAARAEQLCGRLPIDRIVWQTGGPMETGMAT